MVTTVSSREFKQRAGKAKKAADNGPVLITKRGPKLGSVPTLLGVNHLNGCSD